MAIIMPKFGHFQQGNLQRWSHTKKDVGETSLNSQRNAAERETAQQYFK